MTKTITGAEHPILKIFGPDFEFDVPRYQRPYAWEKEHAKTLFDDLFDFYNAEDKEGYFLGSIVLIKDENKPDSEIIDGQQRLTTLTILLSAIASRLNEKERQELVEDHIVARGKKLKGTKERPRLSLKSTDQPFFAKYIQDIQLDELMKLNPSTLKNDAQRNIQSNCGVFISALDEKFSDQESLSNFAKFILTRCFLVVVTTPNQNSAFRVFSVMNSRGLDLLPSDIIKADIVGKLPDEKQGRASDDWESMEDVLGRDRFNDLFTYIRMIYAKEKAKRTLLEEFKIHVNTKNPLSFIDCTLKPHASSYNIISNNSYGPCTNSNEVNELLIWLNRLNFSDWLPPAISFLSQHKDNPEQIHEFFRLLERVSAWIHICGFYVNQRIDIYGKILEEIEKKKKAQDIERLQLSEKEIEQFIKALNGDIYTLTPRRRNYIMLRLDSFLSDRGAQYFPNIMTIEHILPQSSENNEWTKNWPDSEIRDEWVHRLANLVILNRKRNASAGVLPFKEKCIKYFKGLENVTSYALTTQVLGYENWTQDIVEQRQKELLKVFKKGWNLKLNS